MLLIFSLNQFRFDDIWAAIVRWCNHDKSRFSSLNELSQNIIFELCLQSEKIRSGSIYKTYVQHQPTQELLIIFGGEDLSDRSIKYYNSNTESWRRLNYKLPDPGDSPGDRIQSVYCGSRFVFIKRSINCYLFNVMDGMFEHVGNEVQNIVALICMIIILFRKDYQQ